MTAPVMERRRWRSKDESAAQQYSRLRLEIDQATRARDWAKVRQLAHRVAEDKAGWSR